MIYVVPTETMMIRPGQHVDPQGLVYHPYLVGWAEFWDVRSPLSWLELMIDDTAADLNYRSPTFKTFLPS